MEFKIKTDYALTFTLNTEDLRKKPFLKNKIKD
jgi:hypothetical protein